MRAQHYMRRAPARCLPSVDLAQRALTNSSVCHRPAPRATQEDLDDDNESDFVLSILQAHPSVRDSRSYLSSFTTKAFGLSPTATSTSEPGPPLPAAFTLARDSLASVVPTHPPSPATAVAPGSTSEAPKAPGNPLVSALLSAIAQHTALVKVQGPFTDVQLQSIARGLARLQKLGLVSVIVVDRDDIPVSEPKDSQAAQRQRTLLLRDVERLVSYLGRSRATARPVMSSVAHLAEDGEVSVEQEGLDHIRRAVTEGEIPVVLPTALDENCRSLRVGSDRVLVALAKAMATSASAASSSGSSTAASTNSTVVSAPQSSSNQHHIDLTPLRLMVINREGGIPSYARSGMPHLSINLASEYDYIHSTYLRTWRSSHPTALSNLALANNVLDHLPKEASALVVSHRSPAALIANLITNKPAHSASLPHALLTQSEGRVTPDTPTLIRKGLPVRILRSMDEVDRPALTRLLEGSFKRTVHPRFWDRLERDLHFVIVIGDYAGAAVVTVEGRRADGGGTNDERDGICYLDKFAVLPAHQGDGTVDFLWVALRDETYGLGLQDAANPSEGSVSGRGKGRDLVWRSRANNPVNKWYYERSNGFLHLPPAGEEATLEDEAAEAARRQKGWKMFWCDAEQRLREKAREEGREFGGGRMVKHVEDEERGRLERWAPIIGNIESAWA